MRYDSYNFFMYLHGFSNIAFFSNILGPDIQSDIFNYYRTSLVLCCQADPGFFSREKCSSYFSDYADFHTSLYLFWLGSDVHLAVSERAGQ